MKSWKRPPELNFVVLNFVAHDKTATTYVNFELEHIERILLSTRTDGPSLALGASIASLTQPTPVRIAFRILKNYSCSALHLVRSCLLKAVHPGVG